MSSRRRNAAKRLVEWLESDEGAATPLVDIGRALAHHNHGRTRSVVMARFPRGRHQGYEGGRRGQSNPIVFTADAPDATSAVWLLSGFGSQHRKMAKQLYLENPVFRKHVDRVDEYDTARAGLLDRRDLPRRRADLRHRDQSGRDLHDQVALADTMRHFGAEPGYWCPTRWGGVGRLHQRRAFAGGRHSRHLPAFAPDGRGGGDAAGRRHPPDGPVEYSAEDITSVLVDYPDLGSASMRHRRTP